MNDSDTPQYRRLTLGMKAVFLLGSVLVSAAGVQLFFLTEDTDHWFAWTIGVPMTAAFLGAFYWTALAVAWQSFRKQLWTEARVGVLGVFFFISLTFVLTVLHEDRFHFESTDSVAQGAAYLWFVIYLVDPIFVAIAWLHQMTRPGIDAPRRFLLPSWYRVALLVQGALFTAVGSLLFLAPDTMADVWPWQLTPLTSRAMGAWLVGVGLVELSAVWENAWERIEVLTVSYVVLGVLQFVALARYGDALSWDEPQAWLYAASLLSVVLVGSYGSVVGKGVLRGDRTAKTSALS